MQILDELWKNDLQLEKPFIHNRQYSEALSRSSDCEKELEDSFSEKQKELFEAYLKSRDDLTIVTDCETYITGFKLGAKIMIDVLTRGEVSKI